MTKIRTADELSNFLDRELSWRKKEIITIKFQHDGARDHQAVMLRRAGIALLYAHWEGFVKTSGTAYVEYVSQQNLRYRDLRPGFLALAVKAQLEQAADSHKGRLLRPIAEFFVTRLDEKAKLISATAVQTKSNLSAERLRDIVAVLELDYRPFELLEKPIIERLVSQRNKIAHGQFLEVDAPEFATLQHHTLGMLDEFRWQVENAAWTRGFLLIPA